MMAKDFLRPIQYRAAQAKTKAAYSEFNYASSTLNLAHIEERNAELASQAFAHVAKGELFKQLGEISDREREIGLRFARYATYGRCDED